jgi:predicted nucleic acid-binding protein
MKIVLDVNIILSALIRDSITRKMIIDSKLNLYFPEPSLHKIRKYKDYIQGKSNLSDEEFINVLTYLFTFIQLIPSEEIEKNWSKAKEIMEHIDQEDVVFVAAALGLEDSVIWSDDKDFDKQDKLKVLKTEDMVRLM